MERHHEYPKEVLRAVLEHHECLNASGYPRNLSGAQISPLGRCMSLTEVITAMISGEDNGGELRLAVLLRMNMHRYDPALINRVLGLLMPDLDPVSQAVVPTDEPVRRLMEIDEAVAAWPHDFDRLEGMSPELKRNMEIVSDQLGQFQRTLAEAGLVPAQLEQLGDVAKEPMIARELSLLAQEAAWQLRALSRQARRRWRSSSQDAYPQALQQWLERCEALAQSLLGAAAADLDD